MTRRQHQCLLLLGFDSESWDTPGDAPHPCFEQRWEDFTPAQRQVGSKG
jgi:hypothetical protein